MKLAAWVTNLNEVAAEHRGLYEPVEHDGQTVFALPIEGIEDHPAVRPLANAHRRKRDETAKLQQTVDRLRSLPADYSAAEWKRLRAVECAVAEREAARAAEADPDGAEAAAKAQQSYDKAVAERDARIGKQDAFIADHSIHAELGKALVEVGCRPALLKGAVAALADAFVYRDGQVQSRGTRMPVQKFVQRWRRTPEGQAFCGAPPPAAGFSFSALIRRLR